VLGCPSAAWLYSVWLLTGGLQVGVLGGEANVLSKLSPPSSLTVASRPQLCNCEGLRGFRFSLFRPLFLLAAQRRASSTLPEVVSHGLCPDSLHLVNGRA
jgi:hypothetical protein